MPQITITGKIIEAVSNEPLEYATVVLKNNKTNKITGGITNEKGEFSITTIKGTYDITFEFISFKTVTLKSKSLTKSTNLGNIKLKEDSETLDEISIVAEKSTVDIRLDKRIYNVGKDMTLKGGNASDVLDNVPSVDVDVEGNVSLRGNANVRILIDGKPSALVGLNGTDALRQLPSDAIERVEVITSPSARYDAEGTAGILNIILRKGKVVGFNGSLNVTIGDPKQLQISPTLNYRTKKVNLFTNFGYTYRNGPGFMYAERTDFDQNGNMSELRIEDRDFERINNGFNGNFGLEYYITENSSVTGSFFIRKADNENNATNHVENFDPNNNPILSETFTRIQNENEKDNSQQFSLNYTNNIDDKGQRLNIDLQYNTSTETELAINENSNQSGTFEENLTEEDAKETLVQIDYVLPIGEESQFEAGFRGNYEDLQSSFLVTPTPVNDPSNTLDFSQKVNAFYTQYGTKFNKFSLLLGLRTEITDVKVRLLTTNENHDYNYTELFPTVNLGLEANDESSYTLGYSRRLRRPRSWFLNPFESRSSETQIFKGNPGLLPTFTNSFDLGYLYKFEKFTINSSIYYQHSTDVIDRVNREEIRTDLNGDDFIATINEPINLASEDRYGFELTSNYNPSKKVRLSASFNFFQSKRNGEYIFENYSYDSNGNIITTSQIEDLSYKNTSWFARLNSMITLPGNIQWQTRLFYRGPRKDAQDTQKGILSANLAFSKDILKDKGSLVLNVSDLFNSRKRIATSYTPSRENPSSITEQEFQWRVRQISLNFTYRFNQKKNDRKSNRNRNNDFDGGGEEFGG